tara:strand:+ start:644 stop:5254 length:4611 start_codon:yes stop_codon:yes gene_type:complete
MPPYDRRARQRGFNTRIAIPTLSGGVGRQAPSKRLISESQEIQNALPTLEKSIEKRSGLEQLVCKKDGILKAEGGLGLPGPQGASSTITIGAAPLTAASTSMTFVDKGALAVNASVKLTSTDGTEKSYISSNDKNNGSLTEATASFTFTNNLPFSPSTITLISSDSTSKTYESTSGTTGDLIGSNVGFNYGQSGDFFSETLTASYFQEAVYSANGHNANASNTMKFSAALADDSEITLTSTDGTTFTFIARSVGTGFVGDKIIFNSNINTRTQANNLASAINTNMAGKITASDGGGGRINFVQDVDGVGSTSRLIINRGMVNGLEELPKNRFGKLHITLSGPGNTVVNIEQCVGGSTGETTISVAKAWDQYITDTPSSFTDSLNGVYYGVNIDGDEVASNFKQAIESVNGHTSSKFTVITSDSTVTITQATTGSAGNTVVTANSTFNTTISVSQVKNFTDGNDLNGVFNSKSLTLEDSNGTKQIFKFFNTIEKSKSKSTTVGTKDLTTVDDIITQLAETITNNQLAMDATYDSTTSELKLTMASPGGNGIRVVTNDTTLFNATQFRSGLLGRKYFFYWFSISDDLRYLVVIDYSAASTEKLFYIYRLDTKTGLVEDQTPETQDIDSTVYEYLTFGNETYEADEALDAVTIGTNIFFVNKFVKAGFSSNKEGYKFNLAGEVTEEIDYAGKEIVYRTSSVVDPDGTALIYVPNKAYVGGTEVYNQYGVWKALTDIRSESTAQFADDDDGETVIAADPGPPNYATSQFGPTDAALNEIYNVWYPFTPVVGPINPTTPTDPPNLPFAEDGKGRIRVNTFITNNTGNDLYAETVWTEAMTPSELVDPDANAPATAERKWKSAVVNANGIVETEGDTVYDANHSRKVKDKGAGDSSPAEVDEYISLWQFVREVKQIPVEDNRYVDRTKQYLGQAYSDFSNVKLPPHPTDPTDIVDIALDANIPDGIPNYDNGQGNLVGEAAIAMGLLYEGKDIGDYDDVISNSSPNLTTHEDGLGKILFVENAYADALPGFYRVQSSENKPFLQRVRTPQPFSKFDENRMPHRLNFTAPSESNPIGGWAFSSVDWDLRTTGTDETNPGPKLFEEGKQSEIKALGYFRNRMWMAGEDKVFSSSLNNITNFFLEDASSINDEDPIDVTCSYNKYTEVTNLTPFENNLFVNTASDVQFTISGSDNLISPFTAEVSPTSFYSTAPLIKPILLGSQIYFFDKKRLYIYFNDKTVSINNAVEVSYHIPDYLPSEYGATSVVPSYDTLMFVNKANKKEIFCYTNRYSGEQVIQNAFFKYVVDRDVLSLNSYDANMYYVTETFNGSRAAHHIQKQKFQEKDYSIPLIDNRFSSLTSSTYNEQNDETEFVFAGYFNDSIDTVVVNGESLEIQSYKSGSKNTTLSVQGKYINPATIFVGTKYETIIQLSPIFYRDEGQNVVDGVLSLRTMHLRHHNTGNYDIQINNRNRITTPIRFSAKEISSRNDLTPLNNFVVNGETVSKIFGFGDEVKISILSDYISPMNITNIELKGRFNATYSSWVR